MKRPLAAGLVLLLCAAVWVSPGLAHAVLVRSLPAAAAELSQSPASIDMWFSEPLEETFTGARLLNSSGDEQEVGPPVVDPADPTHLSLAVGRLDPGIYTVAWQTLSQVDGHEWSGSFPFTVLNPDGSRPAGGQAPVSGGDRGQLPSPAEVAARWLTLAGGLLLFGVALFSLTVASPGQDGEALVRQNGAPAFVLLWLAILLLFAGDWAQLLLQVAGLGGLDQLPDLLFGARVVRLAQARQLLVASVMLVLLTMPQPGPLRHRERRLFFIAGIYPALLILLLWLGREQGANRLVALVFLVFAAVVSLAGWLGSPDSRRGRQYSWLAIILAAAAALYTLSASSHAGAVPGRAWAILGDYIHLLAAGAWLGGLVLLALLLWRERRVADGQIAARRLLLVRRFSILASFSVFVLVLTGLFNSLVELPDLQSLWSTVYGRVLMLKLLLVGLALALAFMNNYVVHRGGGRWPAAGQLRLLKRQIVVEVGVAILLLLSVAVLVRTPAPRGLAGQQARATQSPFNVIVEAGDFSVHALVTPNQVGENNFWLHLYDPAGGDIGDVQLVRLLFDYQESALGQSSVDLEPLGQGTFGQDGAYLNQPGTWQISTYVRRRGLDDALAPFLIDVPLVAVANATLDPWQNPIPAIPAGAIIGLALVALGLIPILWRQPLRRRLPQRFGVLRIAGLVLVAAGILLASLAVLGSPVAG